VKRDERQQTTQREQRTKGRLAGMGWHRGKLEREKVTLVKVQRQCSLGFLLDGEHTCSGASRIRDA
jgi:hypothetical protein